MRFTRFPWASPEQQEPTFIPQRCETERHADADAPLADVLVLITTDEGEGTRYKVISAWASCHGCADRMQTMLLAHAEGL